MKVTIVTPFSDRQGRVWKKGKRYDVSDETGAEFIDAGFAKAAYEQVVADLAEAGAGLSVTDETDPALIAEAKRAKLPIHKARAKKEAA